MTKLCVGRPRPPLPSAHVECSTHPGTLLAGLQNLRRQGLLFDVTLRAGGEAFFAHKAVLASCSDYFRAMFTDAMKESRENEVTLNGVTAAGIRLLLDFAYSSSLDLTLANIQDVLSAASHVQLVSVVEACSIYLQAQIDLENCIDIATLAETYSLNGLRNQVYRFMSGNLRAFAATPDFPRLSLSQLEHLLSCDFPVNCSEAEVLDIVIKWLQSRNEYRESDLKILEQINFNEIQLSALNTAVANIRDPFLSKKIMLEAGEATVPSDSQEIVPLVNSRGMELAILKVGGFGLGGITNDVTYYLAGSGKWRRLTSIPHVEQCNFGTAVLENKLFVVGGCFNLSLQENIHPFGFRYCPQANEWHTISPMQRERCRFSLNVVSGRLYAVGGSTEEDDDSRDDDVCSCECYDPVRDSWENITSATGHRSQHAGASWPAISPHSLFISGGLDRDLVLSSVQCLDTRTGTWSNKASLLYPRTDHVMLTLGNYIYVCGGWRDDENSGARVLVDTIDRYDPAKDQWETISRVPYPRYHAGIVSVRNKIYFIGGFHSDALFDRATASVDCYDLETNSWGSTEKYPEDIWEHSCVTLYVPRCRDDMEVIPPFV